MGSIEVSASTVLEEFEVRVFVGGALRSDVFCTSVAYGMGTEGSTAALLFPAADWDGGKAALRGESVRVDVGYTSGNKRTVFAGYISAVDGTTSGRTIGATAVSIIGLTDGVYVGQRDVATNQNLEVFYPQRALRGGILRDTDWRVVDVLRDIFSASSKSWRGGGGSLPSNWRSRLKLRGVTVLSRQYNTVPLGDLVFRQTTLREALDTILGIVGTVSFRESFDGNTTYLDFFELGDPTAPVRTVRVARPGESIAGTNALDIGHSDSLEGVRTRIIGLGDRRRCTLSLTSAHLTAPLEKGWDTALEASVLAAPEKGDEDARLGLATDDEAGPRKLVFRKFLLPECLRMALIDKALALNTEDGSEIPIQVWKWGRTPVAPTEEEPDWTSTADELTPTLLDGVELHLEDGYFLLSRPAVNFVGSVIDETGTVVDTYEAAAVGITLSVSLDRLAHDTDADRSILLDGIGSDGLVEVVENESFRFLQTTNVGFPLPDSNDVGHTFATAWIFLGDEWVFYDGATVLQDDEQALRKFTEGALREKKRPRETYDVTTPFWTDSYRLGDRVRIVGQDDYEHGTHQIKALSYELGSDHRTTFSTDNQVPMVSSQILGGGGL